MDKSDFIVLKTLILIFLAIAFFKPDMLTHGLYCKGLDIGVVICRGIFICYGLHTISQIVEKIKTPEDSNKNSSTKN